MFKTKKLLSVALSVLMIFGAMSTSAFAQTTTPTEEKIYTTTIEVPIANYALSDRTVTASGSMGMFLDAGESGWSSTVTARFSSLPSTAQIREIEVDPGRYSSAGMGAIVGSKLRITSPDGFTREIPWSASGMTSNSAFFNDFAKGNWGLQFYGTNISNYNYGSLSYKYVKMTITYAY